MKAKVAIIRSTPNKILEDYIKLFELADGPKYLDNKVETILKDNISWHYPFPSANTTPWQLEGTILALKKHNFNKISCVQNKTVVTNAFKGEDLNNYVPLFKKYNIDVRFNFKKEDMKWVVVKPKAKMLALNKIFHDKIRIPDYFLGKNIIHLPTTKCHIYTTITGAMKNAFGGLLSTKRHYTHTWIHETLVDLLAIQKEIHPGIFCMMDGTTAGNGPGPRIMEPIKKDVILSSCDQVAIDAVAAKIMGFDPMKLKFINLAHNAGLGVGDPRDIEIVGDKELINENWNFSVGKSFHKMMGWLSWYGPTKFLQKLLFHTPLLYIAIVYSEIYHDYFHWPFIEKKIYNKWLKESEWGILFKEYLENGNMNNG